MKSPLVLHIMFHPASEAARSIARALHSFLNGNPVEPGLRVNTRFCPELPDHRPPPLDLHGADRNFIVVLADAHLNTDDAWKSHVGDVFEEINGTANRLVPIQLSEHAWPLDRRLRTTNFARAFAAEDPIAYTNRVLLTELCRHLAAEEGPAPGTPAPTTVFLSHTKLDINHAPSVFSEFVEYLNAENPVAAWVDTGDIATGADFEEAIESGVHQTSMVCLLTDNYSSREYCRKEILLAKRHDRPLVVVDAIETTDVRGFPYLGNTTVIRWAHNPAAVIDALLKEMLRNLIVTLDLTRDVNSGEMIFRRPPEMLTVLERGGVDATILYPDPPLGRSEAEAVERTGAILTTPLQRIASSAPLKGRTIALSIAPSTDIHTRGLDTVHLDAATLDICRYLLVAGATLAYGGHLGDNGYTERLGELVRAYNRLEGVDPVQRIRNYRGWPLPRTTLEQRDARSAIAEVIETDRPDDVNEAMNPAFIKEPSYFDADISPEHRYAWARGMTEMRIRQTENVDARIVIGGTFGPTPRVEDDGTTTFSWYKGLMPGVLEEILISAGRAQPVFLIGAFGGVAALAADIIEGRPRAEASWDYQKGCPHSEALRSLYAASGADFPDYAEISNRLVSDGYLGLNPLLEEDEHRELASTLDTKSMVRLLLTGLSRLQ